MRKTALLLMLILLTSKPIFSGKVSFSPLKHKINTTLYGIKDGWYTAKVKYTNYSTGTNATYKLDVKVEFNNVVKIDFGNDGSVHTGYNNEGYIFSGGYLNVETDYTSGDILSASTTVTISDTNGMKYFKITIE
jgi:hypothetical protein